MAMTYIYKRMLHINSSNLKRKILHLIVDIREIQKEKEYYDK